MKYLQYNSTTSYPHLYKDEILKQNVLRDLHSYRLNVSTPAISSA